MSVTDRCVSKLCFVQVNLHANQYWVNSETKKINFWSVTLSKTSILVDLCGCWHRLRVQWLSRDTVARRLLWRGVTKRYSLRHGRQLRYLYHLKCPQRKWFDGHYLFKFKNMNYMYSTVGKHLWYEKVFNVVYCTIFSGHIYTYNDTCHFGWKSYKEMRVSA